MAASAVAHGASTNLHIQTANETAKDFNLKMMLSDAWRARSRPLSGH